MNRLIACALFCSLAAACTSQPPFVVLTIEDEEDVAIGAVTLAIGSDPRALAQRGILGRDFPITVTLTSESEDEKTVWVEAWDFGDEIVARGWANVAFDDERPPTAVIRLGRACETTEDCEDNLFCNGPATCESRVCISGEKPCAPSPFECVSITCVEAGRTCSVGVNHALCEPINDGNGNLDPAYCAPAAGCVRGQPCTNGQDCQDGAACNGAEECVSNHCIAGPPPNVDDGSPCTIDVCREPDGPEHLPVMTMVPITCTAPDGVIGECNNGRCLTSDCGDGAVNSGTEACDDGNDNKNDACHECRFNEWVPSLITGYGIGAGDPLNITLGTIVGLAVDRRGSIYVADGDNGLVFALDPVTNLATVVAGSGALPFFEGDATVFGGSATDLGLGFLNAVTADSSGNVYFSDDNYARVFRSDVERGLATVFAGTGAWDPGPLGHALATPISVVSDLFLDGRGNLFVASESYPSWVVRIDANTQLVSLIAGSAEDEGFAGDGGPGDQALLAYPSGIAVDTDGNVFIADTENNRIRRVDAFTNIIDTFAGNGASGNSGDGRPARQASLSYPEDVALDGQNLLYIADTSNSTIRRVDLMSTEIQTYAGPADGVLYPNHVAVDRDSNLLIANSNGRVLRKNRIDGTIETVLGGGTGSGARAVRSTSTPLYGVEQVQLDAQGGVLFATSGALSRLDVANLTLTSLVATGTSTIDAFALAPNGDIYFAQEGLLRRRNAMTGALTTIATDVPLAEGMVVDRTGAVLLTEGDSDVHRILRYDPTTGASSTFAGIDDAGFMDGPSLSASFNAPMGLAIDASGHIYVADYYNSRVRRIDGVTGLVTTVAGDGTEMISGDGGPATNAGVPYPLSIAFDAGGRMLIVCEEEIRRVDNGTISTILSGGADIEATGDGGPAIDATGLYYGIAANAAGDLLIAADDRVRRVDGLSNVITTVAGLIEPTGDGNLPQTKLSSPNALAEVVDGTGRSILLFADGASGRVRAIDRSTNKQWTAAGYPGGLETDGVLARYARTLRDPRGIVFDRVAKRALISEAAGGTIVSLNVAAEPWTLSSFASGFVAPEGMAIDPATNALYIADAGEHVLWMIDLDDPAQTKTLIAGQSLHRGYFGDDTPAADALLYSPRSVAVGRGGIYIGDVGNRRVRRIDSRGNIHDVLGDGSTGSGGSGRPARILPCDEPLGLAVDPFGNLFVASKDTLRIVTAGQDGIATGDDEVLLVYGVPPREKFPEPLTNCLAGTAIAGDGWVYQLDRCRGFLLELQRTPRAFEGMP